MTIRLLVSDLDGTLADRNAAISPESLAAIQRARAAGIHFVLATGRLSYVLDRFLDQLGVTDEPIIMAHGALVAQRDGRVWRRMPISANLAIEASHIAAKHGAGMVYFTDHEILVDEYAFPSEEYAMWFGNTARLDGQAATRHEGELIKFVAVHQDAGAVAGLLDAWRAHFQDRAAINRSWDHFVEGTTPGADKGAAVAWLCEQMGITADEVLAVGDGGNDVSMLRWAGFSAAPASGDPDAIAAAKWIAPPITEHPVAAALDHFFPAGKK